MKPASDTRKPYGGQSRSLVIALDVGTTFSGVSYAILEPGEVPKIHGVTRFPGQEHVAGNSKIPSVMYYDKRGKMQAAGAEAETAAVQSQAEEDGWIKAELFKLRMRPKAMKLQMNGMRLSPLPRGKSSVDVFGEFLAYLFRCTRIFITDTHANGPALWNDVQHNMQFVLSHPNGWEGAQQTKMRRAAVYGGLIPDTDEGKARIRFVTEGEASLHACVLNGLAADVLSNPSRHGFLVADAGGGTLDISSYAIRGTVPLVIEEIAPPDCVFSGSVFVSRRARAFLQEKLKNSKYGTPDSVDHITKRFDETTKRLFRDRKDLQFIPFGSPLDRDISVGIRGGQLKLTGDEVAQLFEPSIEAAVASIKAQIEASQGVVRSVWLVGGFAASPWLFSQLQERLAPLRVTVSRPDTQTSKAVADGAIGFYCDHHVSARMSKFMYGVEFLREFDPRHPEHIARRDRLCELPSGPKLLPDAFDCILSRSVKVKESTVFSRKYCTELTSLSTLSVFEVEIWCYRGGDTIPPWILRQAEEFSTLCVVRADLSPLSGSAQPKQSRSGKAYWTIVFSVEIHFGLTEFKARIKWVDNGRTRYGPASIIYNESGSRGDEDEPESGPDDELTHAAQSRITSRGHSPASYTSGGPSNRMGSAVEFPRAEPTIGTPSISIDIRGGFERERAGSRGMSFSSTAPPAELDVRGRSRRGSERAMDPPSFTAREKGKERERVSSGFTDRGAPPVSRTISATSKLGETLTDTWGPITKGASPLSSPIVESSRPSQPPSVKVATPKVATPKEKTREPSILGDPAPTHPPIPEEPPQIFVESLAPPPQIDTQLPILANPEPPSLAAFGFGDNNNNNNNNTSWTFDAPPAPPAPAPAPAPDPEPESPVEPKKKKGGKTSKLGSKAASTGPTKAPTPFSKTPRERSPKNDWATLDTTPDPPVFEQQSNDWTTNPTTIPETIAEVAVEANGVAAPAAPAEQSVVLPPVDAALSNANIVTEQEPQLLATEAVASNAPFSFGSSLSFGSPSRFGSTGGGIFGMSWNSNNGSGNHAGTGSLGLDSWGASGVSGNTGDSEQLDEWGLTGNSNTNDNWEQGNSNNNDNWEQGNSNTNDNWEQVNHPNTPGADESATNNVPATDPTGGFLSVPLDNPPSIQQSPLLTGADAGKSAQPSVHGTPNPSPSPVLNTANGMADVAEQAPATPAPATPALGATPAAEEGNPMEKVDDISTKKLTSAQKKKAEKEVKEKAKKEGKGKGKKPDQEEQNDAGDVTLGDEQKGDNLDPPVKLSKAQQKKKDKEEREAAERAENEKMMEELQKELEEDVGESPTADKDGADGKEGGDADGAAGEENKEEENLGLPAKKGKKKKGKK